MVYTPPLIFFTVPEVRSESIGYRIFKCGMMKKETPYNFFISKGVTKEFFVTLLQMLLGQLRYEYEEISEAYLLE